MNNKPTLLTPEGLEKLQKEHQYLTTTKRAEIAERIYQAKEEGDLRENAEYDEAKREQGFVEGRIKQLEHMLKHVKLIRSTNGSSVIRIGSTVTILEEDLDEEETETYTIVGAAEASPQTGRISNESPWGKAMLGKKVGDSITVKTPGGEVSFEVIEVE